MGFSFNGIHSSEFTHSCRTVRLPCSAAKRVKLYTAPLSDGSIDLSAANTYSRYFSTDLVSEVCLLITAATRARLESKLSRISAWLSGSGELIFDALPWSVWEAAATEEIAPEKKSSGYAAEVSVRFRMKPYCKCIYSAEDLIRLRLELPLDTDVALNASFTVSKTFSSDDTAEGVITNCGTAPTPPIIVIEPVSSGVSVTIGGKTLTYSGDAAVTIDCSDMSALSDGVSVIEYVGGDVPELSTGENSVSIDGAAEVTIYYTPRFLYSAGADMWLADM